MLHEGEAADARVGNISCGGRRDLASHVSTLSAPSSQVIRRPSTLYATATRRWTTWPGCSTTTSVAGSTTMAVSTSRPSIPLCATLTASAAGLIIVALAVTARGLVPDPEVRTHIGEPPSVSRSLVQQSDRAARDLRPVRCQFGWQGRRRSGRERGIRSCACGRRAGLPLRSRRRRRVQTRSAILSQRRWRIRRSRTRRARALLHRSRASRSLIKSQTVRRRPRVPLRMSTGPRPETFLRRLIDMNLRRSRRDDNGTDRSIS